MRFTVLIIIFMPLSYYKPKHSANNSNNNNKSHLFALQLLYIHDANVNRCSSNTRNEAPQENSPPTCHSTIEEEVGTSQTSDGDISVSFM